MWGILSPSEESLIACLTQQALDSKTRTPARTPRSIQQTPRSELVSQLHELVSRLPDDKAQELLGSIAASESEVASLVRERAESRGFEALVTSTRPAAEVMGDWQEGGSALTGVQVDRERTMGSVLGEMPQRERACMGEIERELELEIERQIQLDQVRSQLVGDLGTSASGQWM